MYKQLIISTKKTTEALVSLAEEKNAVKFSGSFTSFCLENDGAKFTDAEIESGSSQAKQCCYGIREFIPIKKIGDLDVESWDPELIAFAEASGGNYFVFKRTDMTSVFFWDHETNLLELVSKSFGEFLDGITKADYSDLPEPENLKVWVNPVFLKKQKDLGNA
ncbi:SMI1 / KNR4 family protein [Pseudovibrio sp. Ad37]|nr:SMI1 / KNR4 family protein [Pseudovibrio sp. Ad37]